MVFPAQAGMILSAIDGVMNLAGIPRAGGDDPNYATLILAKHAVFPVQAGMILQAFAARALEQRIPRAGGDDPLTGNGNINRR